jgi:DNA helicase-2/ATP-dependent DNA helicase PcrA
MTVHSSKGLEFPIVFLFGVEALRVPESLGSSSEEDANRARVAYVGMTRAQDRLYLTYTRSNPILDRALGLKQWCNFRAYPEDCDFD